MSDNENHNGIDKSLGALDPKELYQIFFEEAPFGMLATDPCGRFIVINRKGTLLTGYSRKELLDMTISDLISPEDLKRDPFKMENLRPGEIVTKERSILRKDGSLLQAEISLWKQQEGNLLVTIYDIPECTKAEERLAESERKYRELVEQANSIILRWTSDGRLTFLNEFGQRFFGYSAEEIIGRHVIGTIVPKTETSGRDLLQLMEQICADPKAFEQNVNENMRRNGERVWISWTNRIVPDDQGQIAEILSIGTDITDRRRAEDAIARERIFSDNIINSLPGIFYMYDDKGKLIRWSKKAEDLTGYSSEELLGRSILNFFPEEYKPLILKSIETVFSEEENYTEAPLLYKDGKEIPYFFSSRLVMLDNRQYILGVGVDITERKRAEDEIHRLHKQLQHYTAELEHRVAERTAELAIARDKAEESDRIKSAFLATMSHELRTPLNSIIGFTGILLQGLAGPLNEEQQKQMSMVQNSSRHLLALINDVLDISKIEAGQLSLSFTSFELRPSIEKMVKLVSPLAEKKGIDLRVEIADDLAAVASDQRRLEQIILNLLNNALKFTEKGHVQISCRTDKDHYILSVSDTGIGIRQEEIPGLFQPFHQIDTGLSRKREGTGLGLSICKKLIGMMGGTIQVESQWGRGSTFTIRFPRETQIGGLS